MVHHWNKAMITCAGSFLLVFHQTLFCGIFSNCKNRCEDLTRSQHLKLLIENLRWPVRLSRLKRASKLFQPFGKAFQLRLLLTIIISWWYGSHFLMWWHWCAKQGNDFPPPPWYRSEKGNLVCCAWCIVSTSVWEHECAKQGKNRCCSNFPHYLYLKSVETFSRLAISACKWAA